MFRWFTIICLVGGCDVVFQIDHVPPWSSVAAGNGHTCALRDDHTLYCWGDNSDGQLGIGESPIEADTPMQVESTWQAVSTSNTSTCAIDVDRFLWCWGRNLEGQVGLGNASSASVPQKLEGTWTQISVGSGHVCGIRDDGSLWCWGSNMYGQLGDGTISSQFSPTQISTDHWSSVSAGQRHTCGVEADGSLWCWGRDRDGELGDGMLRDMSTSPVLVGTDRWAQVVTGGGTVDNNSNGVTCGRTIDGHVRCWGAGAFGTIGDDRKLSSAVPTDVLIAGAAVTDWVDIAMTGLHACGRRADGTLWCWGDDSRGQVGTDLPAAVATSPLQVIGGSSRWDALAAGSDHTCAVGNGELWCFGGEAHGQLGRGIGSHRRPVLASAGPWSAVSSGGAHTCVLDRAGGVSCGGDNSFAQLGDATRIAEKQLVPISAPGMSSITAGSTHTCSIATDRTLWCWGYNGRGALGDGTTQRASMPEQVSTEPWTSVAAKQQTCGIRPDGSLWCWGYNYYGQVGNGSTTDPIVTPAQVQAGTSWKAVAAGGVASCGLDAGATLWCWGRNGDGQLGTGDFIDTRAPVISQASTSFDSIAAGGYHACAWTTNGPAACWGNNSDGELGIGNNTTQLRPAMLAGSWRQLAPGQTHTCGIRADGVLLCWGSNVRGQLGDGTFLDRFLPTPVSEETDWASVTTGAAHTCALKTDGSLWCWGADDDGQLVDDAGWTSTPTVL